MVKAIKLFIAFNCFFVLSSCSFLNSSDGGFYQNDGPPQNSFQENIEDAVPRIEPFYKPSLRKYKALGQTFYPIQGDLPFEQTGKASWYGKQFHGEKTSTGEIYNMFLATAAHPTLPLPSYVLVKNLENDREIIVRVNDRGPFLHSRIIDLSYAAAQKLEYVGKGTANVHIQRLTFDDIRNKTWLKPKQKEEIKIKAEHTNPVQTSRLKYFLQLNSFVDQNNAEKKQLELLSVFSQSEIKPEIIFDKGFYKILIPVSDQHLEREKFKQYLLETFRLSSFTCIIE